MLLSEWHHTGPWTWRRMKWPQTPQPALKQFGFFVVQKENNERDNNRCRSRDDMFHSQAFIKKRVSEQQSVSTLKIIFPSNLPLSSTSVPAFIYLYKWTPQIVCLLASNNQSDLQRVSVHCSLHFMKLPSLSTDQVSNSLSILYIINNHLINYPSIVCVMLSDFTLMGRETVLSKKKEEEGSWWLIGSIDNTCSNYWQQEGSGWITISFIWNCFSGKIMKSVSSKGKPVCVRANKHNRLPSPCLFLKICIPAMRVAVIQVKTSGWTWCHINTRFGTNNTS